MNLPLDTRMYDIKTEPDAIARCARILRAGGLVAFPTETVYGLGALATHDRAVRRIFEAKGRPQDNPLIAHIADVSEVVWLTKEVPERAWALFERFWPGPLSVVLRSSGVVAASVSAGLDTVAVRMPANDVALALVRAAGPLAAPSANASGRPSPTTAAHVYTDLAGSIEAIIDAGPTGIGLESTVVDLSSSPPALLRPGGITYEQIREILPDLVLHSTKVALKPRSPGQKYVHYSPDAPLMLVKGADAAVVSWRIVQEANNCLKKARKVGILATSETADLYRDLFDKAIRARQVFVLDAGSRAAPDTIAAHLFGLLRQFDRLGVERIFAEGVEETHIGAAIMDRLGRAAVETVDLSAKHLGPIRVLFVCTGNTCRSPMAELLARAEAEEAGLADKVEFLSAGLRAYTGAYASTHALTVMAEQGLDLHAHRARPVTDLLVESADLVLAMTRRHRDELMRRFPQARDKVHTLAEFASGFDSDLPDPFGGPIEGYAETAKNLKVLLKKMIPKLKQYPDSL